MNEQTTMDFMDAEHCPTIGHSATLDWMKKTIEQLEKFRLDILAALSYSRYSHSYDDVVQMVMLGKLVFVPLEKSFLMSEIHTTPNYRTYHTFLAGGDLEEIKAYQPTILETARAANCKYLSITGRRGWERAFKDLGWSLQYVTLYKEVDE